ncbi:hypothetical protein OGAPHI_002006 [Ogataea philodendri]|uniref:Uncharacterized protein n=1 Tax=Ogataea philodendri TaxID=1378263 RepID=A0A9P8PA63_9ASCO|nr:uncharacterized protein OGAPHI_002006 [Ogataea philodendri]KAH3668252.1 hypothetical protein OGAPHI_002006 [Ogataea philodendri]
MKNSHARLVNWCAITARCANAFRTSTAVSFLEDSFSSNCVAEDSVISCSAAERCLVSNRNFTVLKLSSSKVDGISDSGSLYSSGRAEERAFWYEAIFGFQDSNSSGFETSSVNL